MDYLYFDTHCIDPPTMKSIYSYMILMKVYTKYFKKTKTFI